MRLNDMRTLECFLHLDFWCDVSDKTVPRGEVEFSRDLGSFSKSYKHERGTPLFFRCNCFRRFFRIVSSIQASRVRVSGPTQHRKLTSWYLFWVNIIDYQLGEFTCRSLLALPLITIFDPTFAFWKVLQSKVSLDTRVVHIYRNTRFWKLSCH